MNVMPNPRISVVMPVHNALPFLDESIESILGQTLNDFEFVILDDASTDGSIELLREWARRDQRIRLHESTRRLGLAGSSNAVVAKAQAPIVARMDADDIAHPDRLSQQWNVIASQPDIAVIGTLCNGIDATGRVVRPRDRWRLLRRSAYIPFPHGSAMFRRASFEEVGGYNERAVRGEDQDLFARMAAKGTKDWVVGRKFDRARPIAARMRHPSSTFVNRDEVLSGSSAGLPNEFFQER